MKIVGKEERTANTHLSLKEQDVEIGHILSVDAQKFQLADEAVGEFSDLEL